MGELSAFSNHRIKGFLGSVLFRRLRALFGFGLREGVPGESRRRETRVLFRRLFPASGSPRRDKWFYAIPLGVLEDGRFESGEEML